MISSPISVFFSQNQGVLSKKKGLHLESILHVEAIMKSVRKAGNIEIEIQDLFFLEITLNLGGKQGNRGRNQSEDLFFRDHLDFRRKKG